MTVLTTTSWELRSKQLTLTVLPDNTYEYPRQHMLLKLRLLPADGLDCYASVTDRDDAIRAGTGPFAQRMWLGSHTRTPVTHGGFDFNFS